MVPEHCRAGIPPIRNIPLAAHVLVGGRTREREDSLPPVVNGCNRRMAPRPGPPAKAVENTKKTPQSVRVRRLRRQAHRRGPVQELVLLHSVFFFGLRIRALRNSVRTGGREFGGGVARIALEADLLGDARPVVGVVHGGETGGLDGANLSTELDQQFFLQLICFLAR